jgi:hypothetical protein
MPDRKNINELSSKYNLDDPLSRLLPTDIYVKLNAPYPLPEEIDQINLKKSFDKLSPEEKTKAVETAKKMRDFANAVLEVSKQ